MKVLVIGNGGREHALAWKLAQSPHVIQVFVAPGNAGTAGEPKIANVPIGVESLTGLCTFAKGQAVDLTVIGPETPLVGGIVDIFKAAGLAVFGPSAAAARLEGSKTFAKTFMQRHGIPTPAYASFTQFEDAATYIRAHPTPLVIKADGLAAGKGVLIANTHEAALAATKTWLTPAHVGAARRPVIIEAYLTGEEASFICLVDGEHILPLATAQDHKARDAGDQGPNTGGMGAYSPAPVITPELKARILREVMEPAVRGMAAEGHPYVGFLYAGLMIDPQGAPWVLEFNCRLGDPETQPILMRLESDLAHLILAALNGRLVGEASWRSDAALGVVLAAAGYPGGYRQGDVIAGLAQAESEGVKVFHAGTTHQDGAIVTHGGRVLCATALGETVTIAQARAYEAVSKVHWAGMFCRDDIGWRAITREQAPRKQG